MCNHADSVKAICELCGSDDNAGKDPNGEILCADCLHEVWFEFPVQQAQSSVTPAGK